MNDFGDPHRCNWAIVELSPMKLAPRIRLRTIFLLFFCAAVGLTSAVAPPPPEDPTTAGLIYEPQLNWQIGLMSAASVMIVAGLFQQMRQLARMNVSGQTQDNNISFARCYGISWRAVVTITITAVVNVKMLVSRRILELPEHRDYLSNENFPDQLWVFCFIIVLSNSIMRWKSPTSQTLLRWRSVAVWGAGTVLVLILLPHQTLITFLVHIATAGVEGAIPLSQQRLGTFPNHASEGFRVLWTCLGAVVIVVLAAMALMSIDPVDTRGRRLLKTGSFVVLFSAAIAFCGWYYWVEFYRISPDFAVAGFPGSWLDWLGASLLAAFAVSVGAYRQARGKHTSRVVEYAANESDKISLHETFTCQLLSLPKLAGPASL